MTAPAWAPAVLAHLDAAHRAARPAPIEQDLIGAARGLLRSQPPAPAADRVAALAEAAGAARVALDVIGQALDGGDPARDPMPDWVPTVLGHLDNAQWAGRHQRVSAEWALFDAALRMLEARYDGTGRPGFDQPDFTPRESLQVAAVMLRAALTRLDAERTPGAAGGQDDVEPAAGEPAYPAPGAVIPGQPGYRVGECGHRVAASEWAAGYQDCERCGPDDWDGGGVDDGQDDEPAGVGGETVPRRQRRTVAVLAGLLARPLPPATWLIGQSDSHADLLGEVDSIGRTGSAVRADVQAWAERLGTRVEETPSGGWPTVLARAVVDGLTVEVWALVDGAA